MNFFYQKKFSYFPKFSYRLNLLYVAVDDIHHASWKFEKVSTWQVNQNWAWPLFTASQSLLYNYSCDISETPSHVDVSAPSHFDVSAQLDSSAVKTLKSSTTFSNLLTLSEGELIARLAAFSTRPHLVSSTSSPVWSSFVIEFLEKSPFPASLIHTEVSIAAKAPAYL